MRRENTILDKYPIWWVLGLLSYVPSRGFNNNVSRLLSNVVDAFVRDGALPGSRWIAEEKQWR